MALLPVRRKGVPGTFPFILFPVGYPAADCTVPAIAKKPLGEVTTWLEAGG